MANDLYCTCNDFTSLQVAAKSIFVKDAVYGWLLSWIELTEEKGYTQVHKYGIPIIFCPMCGKLLNKN